MQFASLGSGSRGNSLIIASQKTFIMIDCGFSLREVQRRMTRLALHPEQLAAVIVTHEHTDHISGVGVLARKYQLPVYTSKGTAIAAQSKQWPDIKTVIENDPFNIGDLSLQAFTVPHDAREPYQYIVSDGKRRLGVLTDTGKITPHIEAQLDGCDALVLECNHDKQMLQNSDYPYSLKQRIDSDYGHLSNQQAAGLLENINTAKLKHLAAAHLSDKNNAPELACAALGEALGCEPDWIEVIGQEDGLQWRDL